MKRKILIGLLISTALLTGCATSDYKLYADSQIRIAEANATAQVAKFKALSEIANSGDSAAKVAAVLSINMQGGSQNTNYQIQAPRSFGDSALAWASILLPNVTQMYGLNRQAMTSIAQSNNSAAMQIATINGFVGIAGNIQAPAANVSNVSTVNTSTVRDSNNQTSSVATTRDSNNSTVTRDSNNTSTTSDNRVSNTTTTTTTNTNSNNRTDNTSTPTVVNQPAPVVVTQPAPVVVNTQAN